MQVTFLYVMLAVPLKLAFALAVAMVLNRGIEGLPLYRALFYLPSLLGASVAIAVLWRKVFAGGRAGQPACSRCSASRGRAGSRTPTTRSIRWSLLSVWQFGSPMIIFLAGLRQIPPDLYEAASLDGASRRSSSGRSRCRC